MRFRYSIAVGGTHGRPPPRTGRQHLAEGVRSDFVIAGLLKAAGSNARWAPGAYLVAEAG